MVETQEEGFLDSEATLNYVSTFPLLSFFLVVATRWHVVSVVDRSGPWLRFLRSCTVAKQHLTGTGALDIWYSSTSSSLVCVRT